MHRSQLLALVTCLLTATGCSTKTATPSDMAPDAADDHYLPSGYTLTPFLSKERQLTFAAAGAALAPNKDYQAVIESDAGTMVLDLFEAQTPQTANSFVWLALHHYFDGQAFHRVIENFVAQ